MGGADGYCRTRFRPTANGRLHLGGAYVARENFIWSRVFGGQFVLIVDDVVPRFKYGPKMDAKLTQTYRDQFVEDLDWLGIGPDTVHMASELGAAHAALAERLEIRRPAWEYAAVDRLVQSNNQYSTIASYHPWLVAGRVSDDHELNVTGFVRGGDLIQETCLYDYLATRAFGHGYRVYQDYTFIVIAPGTEQKDSKSFPVYSIAEYRERGVTAAHIWEVCDILQTGTAQYGSQWQRYEAVPDDALKLLKLKRKPD